MRYRNEANMILVIGPYWVRHGGVIDVDELKSDVKKIAEKFIKRGLLVPVEEPMAAEEPAPADATPERANEGEAEAKADEADEPEQPAEPPAEAMELVEPAEAETPTADEPAQETEAAAKPRRGGKRKK